MDDFSRRQNCPATGMDGLVEVADFRRVLDRQVDPTDLSDSLAHDPFSL